MKLIKTTDLDNFILIESWLSKDEIGKKELSQYQDTKQILILVNRLNRHFFLIINKSEKVGFIDLEIQAEDNAYFSFYIKSDKRGQGLGGLAVKKLIEISKGLGVRKLIGEVNPSNKNSQKVLFKEGFIEEKRDKNGYTEFCISLN